MPYKGQFVHIGLIGRRGKAADSCGLIAVARGESGMLQGCFMVSSLLSGGSIQIPRVRSCNRVRRSFALRFFLLGGEPLAGLAVRLELVWVAVRVDNSARVLLYSLDNARKMAFSGLLRAVCTPSCVWGGRVAARVLRGVYGVKNGNDDNDCDKYIINHSAPFPFALVYIVKEWRQGLHPAALVVLLEQKTLVRVWNGVLGRNVWMIFF